MVDYLRYHLLNEKYIKSTLSKTTATTNYKAISQYVAEKNKWASKNKYQVNEVLAVSAS